MRLSNALIEKRRPAFFAAGLLFALSLTLVSFEWRTPYVEPEVSEAGEIGDLPQGIVLTLEKPEEKVVRPEPPKIPEVITNQIDVVDNTAQTSDPSNTFEPYESPDLLGYGSEDDEGDVDDPNLYPLDRAEILPEYCGGEAAMLKFLGENLTYPRIPLDNGMQGVVYVKFVVGKNGKLRDAKIVIPLDPWLDAEALRVAKMLDCFTPGMQSGHKVDVYFVLPVRFAIN
ncbi:MAG: protein TonB [Bacteroidia bacterium]|jgi:protein TonB